MTVDLKNLAPGQQIRTIVKAARLLRKPSRNGKEILRVTLANASGDYQTPVWGAAEQLWDGVEEGEAVEVSFRVGQKPDNPAWTPILEFESVESIGFDHPVVRCLPDGGYIHPELIRAFDARLDLLSQPARSFVDAVIDTVGRDAFYDAPGAMRNHHAFRGGLIRHSTEVIDSALALARANGDMDEIDQDALVAGAALHDLGKALENDGFSFPYERTASGLLLGHMALAHSVIWWTVAKHEGESGFTNPGLIEHVQHIIETHHDTPEWGSSVPPATREALYVFLGDYASYRTQAFREEVRDGTPRLPGWRQAGRANAKRCAPITESSLAHALLK